MSELLAALRESGTFVLSCLGITVCIFLVAWLCQRLSRKPRKLRGVRYLAFTAMLSALAGVLMLLDFPVFFAPGFYKLDLGDLPALIAGIWLGPVAGVTVEFLKVVVKLLLKGTSTAFVGDFASFVTGCSLVLPAAALHLALRGKRAVLLSLGVGVTVMTVFTSLFNVWFLLPRFAQLYGMPLESILEAGTAIWPAVSDLGTFALCIVAPFNLLKGLVSSLVTLLVYGRLRPVLERRFSR